MRARKVKITRAMVKRATSTGDRGELVAKDTDVPGLELWCYAPSKRTGRARKVWKLYYRAGDGRQRRPVLGDATAILPDSARTLARELLGDVARGADPSEERTTRRAAPTVGELCDRYLEEYAEPYKKPSSVAEDRRNIDNHVRPALGGRKVASVALPDIQRLHRGMRDKPIAANRVLAVLSKMFNLAEKWGLRPEHSNPCRHVEKYAERQVHRPLSEIELARLAKVLREAETGKPPEAAENPRAVAALRLLMLTGMRRNEALRLRWDEVDLEAGLLRLGDSKTGAKLVRLNGAAREVIAAQEPMLGNPYVFPSPVKPGAPLYDVKRVWDRIRKRAGLGDARLHDLRHSFAATAAAGGLSLHQIGQLLGHRNPRTTARYSDLVDDDAAKAAEQVGEALARVMAGGGKP